MDDETDPAPGAPPVPAPRQAAPGSSHLPEVAVVAVTFNSAAVIESFVRALPAALEGLTSARVIVVDNDSKDDTVATLDRLAPWIEVRQSGRNSGYAGGINIALHAVAPTAGVLILNPDAVPAPGAARLLAEAARAPGVGITVPRIEDREGGLKFSLRREPTLLRAIGEAVLGGHRAARFPHLGDMIRDPCHYVDGATADWATGAAMFLSRDVLDDVGAWDESYFLYSEETDYALRSRDAGWTLRYVPDAVVRHPGGAMSTSPWLWSILAVNRVKLYRSRHGPVAAAAYWLVVFLNEAVRAIVGRPTHRAAVRALLRGAPRPD